MKNVDVFDFGADTWDVSRHTVIVIDSACRLVSAFVQNLKLATSMPDLKLKPNETSEVDDLKDLLAKQWSAVQQTLEINKSITKLVSTSKIGLGDLSAGQALPAHESQALQ